MITQHDNYDIVDLDTTNLTAEEENGVYTKLGKMIFEQTITHSKQRIKWIKSLKKWFEDNENTTLDHTTDLPSAVDIATPVPEIVLPVKKRRRTINNHLQCDFCGKASSKVRYHAMTLTFNNINNNRVATNFCGPSNHSKNSHCFIAYCKWVNSFNLSRGLPYIIQRVYTNQLQPKNHVTDTECHNCGAAEEGTSNTLVKVPTGCYDNIYDPKLDALGYQMFCKDTNCLEKFVQYIRNPLTNTPCIMKHIKFML